MPVKPFICPSWLPYVEISESACNLRILGRSPKKAAFAGQVESCCSVPPFAMGVSYSMFKQSFSQYSPCLLQSNAVIITQTESLFLILCPFGVGIMAALSNGR